MRDTPADGAHEALIQFLYQAPIGLVQTTLAGEITMANPMAAQLLMPLSADGGLDNLFDLLAAGAPGLRAQAAAPLAPGATVCEALRFTAGPAPDGESATTLSLRLLKLDADTLMASVSDVTATVRDEARRVAAKLRAAGRTDTLTAMPNRAAVLECIERALQTARRNAGIEFAVLFINGDRFNRVNVTQGPAAGDDVLRTMAARVNGTVRQRDAVGLAADFASTTGRLGGDEFVVVLEDVRSTAAAVRVAQRLVDALNRPYTVGAQAVHLSCSVGVVMGSDAAATADADSVLQDASLAMREAKRAGGARACLFEPPMKDRAQRRGNLETELRLAIAGGQLFVVYQPIVALADGSAAGVEALVRWRHPQRGTVPPGEFIEIAEETGLIAPLGAFVLNSACRQFVQWQQTLGEAAPRVLSVNLSRAQLADPALAAQVQHALQNAGLAPGCLQLEITESLAAEDPQIRAGLHALKVLGLTLALDDFGTGYSSLASLHQWPVDVIKIDRSFVSQLETSAHHRVLVEATVRVARSLGMGTVAEGVETAGQAAALRALQCDKGQGYLYARPLAADEATRWLAAQPARPLAPPPGAPAPTALRAEVAERLLERLDRAAIAVALFDPDERLAYANHSFLDVHWKGLDGTPTWEEIMRMAHRCRQGVLIETPDIDGWLAGVRQRYRRQPLRSFESDLTDGRWMRVIEETAADGWMLSVSSDVTSLKVNESALRQARDAALIASITDPLTGLPNRRHVFAQLQELLTEATQLRVPLTVAVIDLDEFKAINDSHGHGVGDQVLKVFAHRLCASLRPRDMLGRIGGEEFLLMLANTGPAGAARVLGEVRAALQVDLRLPQAPGLCVNFSAGVTQAEAGDSVETLWQRADRGLYSAKATGRGRDCVVAAEDAAAVRAHGGSGPAA
ncbi:MAG: EAL domain-containing protein [Rubrivivax sp.]|nr:EAL domain-containing protein [Rubrivivax sp.]